MPALEKPLKIFAISADGDYGAGIAIVAAHNIEEAVKLAGSIVDTTWKTNYESPDIVQELDWGSVPKILIHFENGE